MVGRTLAGQKCRSRRNRSVRAILAARRAPRPARQTGALSLASSEPSIRPLHVSIVAVPEATISTLAGIYDVMSAARLLPSGADEPFRVEIVGERAGPLDLASGVPIAVQRAIGDVPASDIVIVPSLLLNDGGWDKGRHPALVRWLQRMYDQGALLCSACTGIFVLAETGRFDGRDATVHFAYVDAFRAAYPAVRIHPERVLVIAGQRDELVTSGASTTWHDMTMYLIARFAGAGLAQELGRLFALQWHQDGLTPYMTFDGRRDHGDGEILSAQQWLAEHFSVANPVDEVERRSTLAARTFKRRFANATGLSPIAYVQQLRIEDAKRRLERDEDAVDEIGWRVGYEDPAFFRRLFKRITGLSPGAYRKRFRIPAFGRSG
jgi:transcriptional regulator GlxA family with amidase domain